MNLNELTAHELRDLFKQKKVTSASLRESVLKAVAERDPKVKAYLRLIDKQPSAESDSKASLEIPIATKDNLCIKGVEITCASKILQGFKPPYHAAVINKLIASRSFFIGCANMDEFAFGSSTENSAFGPTHNPWDLTRVPGGSSGGSAAAVAAHEAIWALGSDTGGSIRQPASFCGIVGMKPTYGRVSRYGLIAFASSLDQIGPLTKDVTDAAILLGIIAGYDERDSTCADISVPDYTQSLIKDVKGLRIGIPKEYFVKGLDNQVKAAVQNATETLKKLGATFVDISLPHTEYAVATYYIVATAEASSNLARFDGVQYGLREHPAKNRNAGIIDMYEETRDHGFGDESKRRIMLGTYSLSSGYYDAYYLRAQKVRTLLKKDFDDVFQTCDAVLTPTSPTTAFKIGEKATDPLAMYLSDIYTIPANLAGIPAISVPCGFSKEDLPIGLQIMTKPFDEETMLRIAFAYEQATPWHKKKVSL